MAAARQAAELGVRVFTIGVGSPQGTMIPMGDGQYLEDRDGNPVVTRLDDYMQIVIGEEEILH